MKPGLPWSIKGVSPEAREQAKAAAQARGVSLGNWLNQVIAEQSSGEPGDAREPRFGISSGAGPVASGPEAERLAERMALLADKIDVLERQLAGQFGSLESAQNDLGGRVDRLVGGVSQRLELLTEALERLVHRLEEDTKSAPKRPALQPARLGQLNERLSALQDSLKVEPNMTAEAIPPGPEIASEPSPTLELTPGERPEAEYLSLVAGELDAEPEIPTGEPVSPEPEPEPESEPEPEPPRRSWRIFALAALLALVVAVTLIFTMTGAAPEDLVGWFNQLPDTLQSAWQSLLGVGD